MDPLLTSLLEPSGGPGPARLRHGTATSAADCRRLAELAAMGTGDEAALAGEVIRVLAERQGANPASIAPFYAARGRGEVAGFTVPAVNIRGLTFDVASALFRAIIATDSVAIFEINRAELGFTGQTASSFASCVLAAAVAERYTGPVYLQADHMMLNAKAFAAGPAAEVDAVWQIIESCLAASFWNIDIDASTLVDLSYSSVEDQQRVNAEVTAELARRVRAVAPPGIEVSVGGEIGEVGAHNSTVDELVAYVDQTNAFYDRARLRKVSVQTGTKHGGLVMPDGRIAEVALDFETLRELSRVSRERYGMAGAVQHGASTLPDALFSRFPEVETAEVHLATGFQNLTLDHPAFPAGLLAEMEAYALAHLQADRKPGETDAQFLHTARRKLWGPFRAALWALGPDVLVPIGVALEERFTSLMTSLNVQKTGRIANSLSGKPPSQ